MEILLINDNSDQPNWGAIATSYALKRLLEASLAASTSILTLSSSWLRKSYRQVRVPFGWGPVFRSSESSLSQLVLRRFSREVNPYPAVADDFDYCADEWLAGRGGQPAEEFLTLARRATSVVYNGENSIYRNTDEGCRSLFLLYLCRSRLGKPSCIVNHTAHLNDVKPVMRGMVELVYPLLDLVAVREPRSYENLRNLGLKKVQLFPDVVFSLEPEDTCQAGLDGWQQTVQLYATPYFCLSASGLPASVPREGWQGAVTSLVQALLRVLGQGVLLAKDGSCHFLEEVARRTNCIYFGPEHDFRELWPLLSGAAVQITGHFHNLILGAMVGCPFVPLSANNHKMQGVCEHLKWHRTEPFDITFLKRETEGIVNEVKQLLAGRKNYSCHLLDRSQELRSEARELGRRISGLIPENSGQI